jgi:hypothetical protein
MKNLELVRERVSEAKAIAWDTCHKIYVLMDDEQVELMREYQYDDLITKEKMTTDEMVDTLENWFGASCSLRFIQAVSTNPENPNAGFESLISQGEDEDYYDDEN